MFDWVYEVFNHIQDIFSGSVAALYQLYNELNKLTNNVQALTSDNGGLTIYLGAFRYVVGDMIYLTYYFIALFGCLYTLFILIKRVIDMFGSIRMNVFKYFKPKGF